jgi:hypothetical protein
MLNNHMSEEWRFEEQHVAESYIDLPLTCYEQKRPLTTQNNLRETDLINLSSVTSNLGSNKYCMEMLQTWMEIIITLIIAYSFPSILNQSGVPSISSCEAER